MKLTAAGKKRKKNRGPVCSRSQFGSGGSEEDQIRPSTHRKKSCPLALPGGQTSNFLAYKMIALELRINFVEDDKIISQSIRQFQMTFFIRYSVIWFMIALQNKWNHCACCFPPICISVRLNLLPALRYRRVPKKKKGICLLKIEWSSTSQKGHSCAAAFIEPVCRSCSCLHMTHTVCIHNSLLSLLPFSCRSHFLFVDR